MNLGRETKGGSLKHEGWRGEQVKAVASERGEKMHKQTEHKVDKKGWF